MARKFLSFEHISSTGMDRNIFERFVQGAFKFSPTCTLNRTHFKRGLGRREALSMAAKPIVILFFCVR